ncbi:MAG TPA: flagellar motor protein MotB [Rhodospirillaceae bacterium]|nr:flagellar motor protein MotB [Rhodospirillaceae bacterium]
MASPSETTLGFSSFVNGNRKKGAADEPEYIPLWLITFADIMALMLTFFVLLYAMAEPKQEEWSDMTAALNSEFNKFYSSGKDAGQQDTINIEKLDYSSALDLEYLQALVTQLVEGESILQDIVLIPQEDRLIVSLPNDLLFDSGKADIKDKGRRALFTLGGALSRIKNRIEVIGHTDPRPIQNETGEFSSNWELSLARATRAAAVLENVGYRRPITVRGLSSARYDELPPEIGEEKRLDLARRVDIVIMEDDGSNRTILELQQ